MNQFVLLSALTGLVFAMLGCGGSNNAKFDDSMKPALEDFSQFLGSLAGDGVKPPKKVADFIPMEPMAPISAEHIKNGKLVYFWGSGLKAGGQAIVAYEADAETAGGWVLLEDGTVKKLTSEQFASAPKPSKK